jgi:tRNA A37 threonylcarbamoyltransferase TsaD
MLWQIKIHTQYGGVVPELASRAHQQNIVPVIDALRKANIDKEQLSAIAFTQGPGLMGFWWEVLLQNQWLWPYPYLLFSKPYASPYFSSFHR